MRSQVKERLGRLLCMALVGVVGLLAFATPAFARNYTVRVFGGNSGTYAGSDPYVAEVPAGSYFTPSTDEVTPSDTKYYCKGFRLSGADDITTSYFYIVEDTDIVVAYGVRGDMVEYTLHFVEYNNPSNVLAEPRTFEGKVGDKPVAAYEYISGWRPLYRQITGTLQEGSNDWTFEYVRVEEGEEEETPTTPTNPTTTETENPTTTTTTTTTVTTPAAANADANADDTAVPATPADATTDEGTAEGGTPATQEIMDLDNPLASGDQADDTSTTGSEAAGKTGLSPVAMGGVVAALLGIAAGVLYYIRARQKKDDEDEDDGKTA